MRLRRFALITVCLAGCAQPDATSNPGDTPTVEPTPTASAPGEVAELTATGEPLPAGTYTRTGFEPPITFDLDGSWEAVQLFDGFFDVQRLIGTPDVIAVQFANVSGVFGADGATEPSDAADAVEIVAGNDALEVVETSASSIGGLDGSQITVENSGAAHASVLQVPPGPLGIDPGRRLWIAFFDTDAGVLAIMVGGSTERWDDALSAAEPVLESVVIGS